MSNWRINGETSGAISVDDRAVQYGDGVFETIAIRGGTPRHWDLHIERLTTGCERLGIDVPDIDEIEKEMYATIDAAVVDPQFAIAKIVVSAGEGPRGYRRPQRASTTLAIGAFPSRPRPVEAYTDGVDVTLCQTRLAQQPQFAGIKTLNRLEQVVAQSEWRDKAIVDGLMLDTDERLICGTMSNVFLVRGNTVITPAITRCGVSGTMRRKVLELIDSNGIAYEVRDVALDELDVCDELFLSNSQFGLLPVSTCGSRSWPVGSHTSGIMNLLADDGVAECRL